MRVQAHLHLRDFLRTPPTIPSGLAIGFPMLDRHPSFHFLFLVLGESRQFLGARSSLRSVAPLEDVLDESCGGGVEDESLPELVDNSSTARCTKFSVCQVWLLTARPLIRFSMFFAELSE